VAGNLASYRSFDYDRRRHRGASFPTTRQKKQVEAVLNATSISERLLDCPLMHGWRRNTPLKCRSCLVYNKIRAEAGRAARAARAVRAQPPVRPVPVRRPKTPSSSRGGRSCGRRMRAQRRSTATVFATRRSPPLSPRGAALGKTRPSHASAPLYGYDAVTSPYRPRLRHRNCTVVRYGQLVSRLRIPVNGIRYDIVTRKPNIRPSLTSALKPTSGTGCEAKNHAEVPSLPTRR